MMAELAHAADMYTPKTLQVLKTFLNWLTFFFQIFVQIVGVTPSMIKFASPPPSSSCFVQICSGSVSDDQKLPPIIGKEGGLLIKDNYEGGAYEVGSQYMVCPLIVEDLNQPRQMLVEMLCEERGLFLEIADIIRELGLTKLEGLMETRNDKIWARFAVEANRDVTRMEIFMPLVRLLEQTVKNGTTTTMIGNGIENDNIITHQFPPSGGSRPCGL